MNFLWKVVCSCKTELKIIGATLALLFILPVFAVVVIANAGIAEVASALVSINPVTHKVEVRDPRGFVMKEIEVSTVWPVRGYISEEFGTPHLPWQVLHTGVDIANEYHNIGDPVTPFMEGTVIETPRLTNSYGNHVIIDHGDGITSLYGHLSEIKVSVGQRVKPGDVIGLEGSTGASTGPHVHFEIRIAGIPINPHIFMVGKPEPGGRR